MVESHFSCFITSKLAKIAKDKCTHRSTNTLNASISTHRKPSLLCGYTPLYYLVRRAVDGINTKPLLCIGTKSVTGQNPPRTCTYRTLTPRTHTPRSLTPWTLIRLSKSIIIIRCLHFSFSYDPAHVTHSYDKMIFMVLGHNPPDMYPPDTYPLGHIPPGHLPPGHLPPGHLPPRTYTPKDIYPQTLKCPIWFMHHVLITYCTLKSIYFAEIAFICDVGAIKLTDVCLIIIIWPRKKKGKRCDLKKINYNKVNSNFFLSVSKVCASLIC